MGITLLRSQGQVADVVVDPVDKHSANNGDTCTDYPIDGSTVFCGPVAAVKGEKQSRQKEEDHGFADMEPAPIRGKEPPGTADGRTPPQFLSEIEEEKEAPGYGNDTEEGNYPSGPVLFDSPEWVPFPDRFSQPDRDGATHDPGDMKVTADRIGELLPIGRCYRTKILPGIIEDSHVRVHGAKVHNGPNKERDNENGCSQYRLSQVLPGCHLHGYGPGRAQPRSDSRKHQAGQRRILDSKELGNPWELCKLSGVKISHREITKY